MHPELLFTFELLKTSVKKESPYTATLLTVR